MIFSFVKSKQTGAKLTGGVFFFASFLFAQAKRTEVLPKVKRANRTFQHFEKQARIDYHLKVKRRQVGGTSKNRFPFSRE